MEKKTFFTFNPTSEKERRNIFLYGLLCERGRISKPDLSKFTGINIVSISSYVKNFYDNGLVTETVSPVSSGGRRPELVEINAQESGVVGIDLGENAVRAVWADLNIGRTNKSEAALPPRGDPDFRNVVLRCVRAALSSGNKSVSLKAIGVGIYQIDDLAIAEALEKETGVPVFFADRAFCALAGELLPKDAALCRGAMYFFSDCGQGVMCKDGMWIGESKVHAESIMQETVASSPLTTQEAFRYFEPWDEMFSIMQAAKREVAKGVGTKIVDCADGAYESITTATVIKAAGQNDKVAIDIIKSVGINLGLRVAYLINIFRPETVIIGGGAEIAGEMLLEPLSAMVRRLSLAPLADKVKIMRSAAGGEAVRLGAASLAVRELFLQA